MQKNLFEQAKDLMNNFTNYKQDYQGHIETERDAVRKAIQAAYNDATPEQKSQLEQFEQQLNEKINLH